MSELAQPVAVDLAPIAVLSTVRCRSSSRISGSGAPVRRSSVAAACRRGVTSPIPARLLSETKTQVTPPRHHPKRAKTQQRHPDREPPQTRISIDVLPPEPLHHRLDQIRRPESPSV